MSSSRDEGLYDRDEDERRKKENINNIDRLFKALMSKVTLHGNTGINPSDIEKAAEHLQLAYMYLNKSEVFKRMYALDKEINSRVALVTKKLKP